MLEVEITPESIEEYQTRKGYNVEVIDTGGQNKGLVVECRAGGYAFPFKGGKEVQRLFDDGLEALVRANAFQRETETKYEIVYYGLPVRKKK